MGQRNFFSSCAVVSVFWFWWKIGFGFTYLCTQSTIQLRCCVSFSVLVGNSFWCYVRTQCTIQLCGCVSFLVVAGNSSQNENIFLQKNLIGLLYYDPLADVCISQDLPLFYSVSFYFVYFSCTAQIHNLKFKSEYYLRFSHKIRTFYYCIFLSCIIQTYIFTVTIVSQKY